MSCGFQVRQRNMPVGRCPALKTVLAKIESLTGEPGYVYTLALILMRDLFLAPDDIAEINPREYLNIQELTFLVGCL